MERCEARTPHRIAAAISSKAAEVRVGLSSRALSSRCSVDSVSAPTCRRAAPHRHCVAKQGTPTRRAASPQALAGPSGSWGQRGVAGVGATSSGEMEPGLPALETRAFLKVR